MNQAFSAYEAIRHRLPASNGSGACRDAAHLGEIADDFDTVLLDAFGVLNRGQDPIPSVPERVRDLQAAGKRVMVVSNAAGFSHSTLMARYQRLGYEFDPEDVVTSRKTLVRQLEQEPPRHWGLIAGQQFGPEEFPPLDYRMLADDIDDYHAVDGFLFVGASEWTAARQRLLIESLRAHPRRLLVANPDLLAPQEGGDSIEPGTHAHQVQDETGVEPAFYGKPFANIFDLALERLGPGIDRDRTLMVGDTLHTDILGGQAAGIRTALVTRTGVLAGMDIAAAIESSGIAPDWILDQA
ncbi:HAD-IIA family hydrolase [Spiribacter vilamensis]|uniref:HAD superfamily hydrolase (TIGR01450 family) n=1 Tax=Spiribacter vilamensis TaxID=531306 RepID=A0A4Q8CZ66_9GAMM|nr:HAD-IIA family hydrolase [Spiribacter vilamensis]RZU98200.1 HAD superfamily hydrolase (TIGR01450 family) [Spiribacter vilamensis]TVO60899.1 HAD-IIA family hydrolase [Spiribacter vilamensis]